MHRCTCSRTDWVRVSRVPRLLAAATLGGIALLHVAWGRGSTFPMRSAEELADAVAGSRRPPSPAACNAVAVALAVASALASGAPVAPVRVRRLGIAGVVTALGGRSVVGFLGRTSAVTGLGSSPRFRRLDRRVYSPLCGLLALATATAYPRVRRGAAAPR